jgi:hypothetical protein
MLHPRSDISGLEILALAISLKVVVTLLAVLSVIMVTMVYALLIRRGGFMSTTAIFPTKSIKTNIGSLLSTAWPDSTDLGDQTALEFSSSELKVNEPGDRENSFQNAITLFYLGRMKSDKTQFRVAKGVLQSTALPIGNSKESRLWLTSGSPTTKCTIQLLIWEWISVWLMLLMLATVLAYNGFFTNERNLDSYPRLIIILIYMLAFCIHAFHTWRVSLRFLTKVSAGCSWSLIERGNFAVAETTQLNSHIAGEPFQFRSIDKASEEHTPRNLIARFKHEIPDEMHSEGIAIATSGSRTSENTDENANDLAAAHKTLLATQITERDIARTSANEALSRVISNAMIIMAITLSCSFCSWTTHQATANTPNNFSSAQIGSLALLGAVSTGSALLFSSALHLSTMEASFHTILCLRELRINGKAIDHHMKRKSQYKSVAFLDGDIPLSPVRFCDLVSLRKRRYYLSMLLAGPALGLLPDKNDFERRSETAGFDFKIKVRKHFVLLTTRETTEHMIENKETVEAIKICHIN